MAEGLCLDAGALIALERGDRRVVHLFDRVHAAGGSLDVPAGVVAQVWRGARQARVARFLRADGVTVVMVEQNAYSALELCDRAYVLEQGRVTLTGTGAELLDNPHVRSAYLGI